MLTRLRGIRERRAESEGFTLIELIIGLVIGVLIIGALGSALIVSLTSTSGTALRISESQDEQLSSRWFASDVASLASAPNVASSSTPCSSSLAGNPATLLTLQDSTASVVWTLSPVGGSSPLMCDLYRSVGSTSGQVLATNVTSVARPTCVPSSCGSSTQSVEMDVTELQDPRDPATSHQVKYALYGAVRTQADTSSQSPPTQVAPSLLSLATGTCGVTLKGGGNSGVVATGAQTVVIDGGLCQSGNHDNINDPGGTIWATDPSGQNGNNQGTVSTLPGVVPDPLAGLAQPMATPTYTTTTFAGPGTYTAAVNIPSGTTMPSGTYVFNQSPNFGANVTSAPGGVLLVFNCASCTGGFQSDTKLTGLTSNAGNYCGIVMYQPTTNSASLPLNGETLNGLVYMPGGAVDDSGNGSTGATVGQLIVPTVSLKGNANLTLTGPEAGC